MTTTRKTSPDWFGWIDRVRGIRELGEGTGRELAKELEVAEQRVAEWISGTREVKAQKAMEIQNWVLTKEAEILRKRLMPKYKKILEKLRKG